MDKAIRFGDTGQCSVGKESCFVVDKANCSAAGRGNCSAAGRGNCFVEGKGSRFEGIRAPEGTVVRCHGFQEVVHLGAQTTEQAVAAAVASPQGESIEVRVD